MPSRVLIVDDDPSIRRLLTTLVRRERIEVDAAADGQEAIDLLRRGAYAVILLDLMMPRLNGFAVIEWLKKQPREPKPVVFVISAYADPMYRTTDTEIVAGVLHKPFDVRDVASLIRHIVRGWDDDLAQTLLHSRERAIREFIQAEERERTDRRRGH